MRPEPLQIDGEPITSDLLLRLQQQAGNQAVLKLVRAAREAAARERDEAKRQPSRLITNATKQPISELEVGPGVRPRSRWRRIRDWAVQVFWTAVRVISLGMINRRSNPATSA